MLPLVAVLELDQIKCTATYKLEGSSYEITQTCPGTDECFRVNTEDLQTLYWNSAISEASGSICVIPNYIKIREMYGCGGFEAVDNVHKYRCFMVKDGKQLYGCATYRRCVHVLKPERG